MHCYGLWLCYAKVMLDIIWICCSWVLLHMFKLQGANKWWVSLLRAAFLWDSCRFGWMWVEMAVASSETQSAKHSKAEQKLCFCKSFWSDLRSHKSFSLQPNLQPNLVQVTASDLWSKRCSVWRCPRPPLLQDWAWELFAPNCTEDSPMHPPPNHSALDCTVFLEACQNKQVRAHATCSTLFSTSPVKRRRVSRHRAGCGQQLSG